MNNHAHRSFGLLLSGSFILALATAAQAQTYNWTNSAGGVWTTAGNWSPSTVPSNQNVVAVIGTNLLTTPTITDAAYIPIGSIVLSNANTLTLSGAGVYGFNVSSGDGSLYNYLGASTISDPISLTNASLDVNNLSPGLLTLSGVISGGNMLKVYGPGTVFLNQSANTYSGGTLIDGGLLTAYYYDAAFGAAPASPTTNIIFGGNGTLQMTGSGNPPQGLSANRTILVSNNVTATLDSELGYIGTMTVNGAVVDYGTLVTMAGVYANPNGAPQVNTMTFAGPIILNGGIVDTNGGPASPIFSGVGSPTGPLLGGGTVTINGSVTLTGNSSISNLNTATMTSPGNSAATVALLTIAGNVNNNGNALTVGGPGNTTISGAITNGGTLTKVDAGILTLSSANNNYSGGTLVSGGTLAGTVSGALQGNITNNATVIFSDSTATATYGNVLSGSGTNVFSLGSANTLFLTNANTYLGPTVVNSGTLVLTNSAGALASSSGITLNNSTLVLDNRGATNVARIGTGAAINLNGGTEILYGGFATNGAVTLVAGASTMSATNLTSASLARNTGATINFSGTNNFVTAPTLTGGILPYGTFAANDFATTNASGVIVALPGYQTNNFGNASNNVFVSAVTNLVGGPTVNSLKIGANTTNNGTLTLSSGGLLMTAGSFLTNGTVDFGGTEANLISPAAFSIYSSLSGSSGLTKSGAGTLTLYGTNSVTGPINVNQGTMQITGGYISNGLNNVTVNNSTLQMNGGTLVANHLYATNGSGATVTMTSGNLTTMGGSIFTNMLTMSSNMTWNVMGGTNLVLNDQGVNVSSFIVNSGAALNVTGAGTVLTNAGRYTLSGNVAVTNGAVLVGTHGVYVTGGSFLASGPGTFVAGETALSFSGGSQSVISNGAAVVSGPVYGSGVSGAGTLLTVTGPGSVFSNLLQSFGVGSGANLVVTNGGTVYAATGPGVAATTYGLNLGESSDFLGGTAIVRGAGSTLITTNTTNVGIDFSGHGNLIVDQGAFLRSGSTYMGTYGGGSNYMIISDPGTIANLGAVSMNDGTAYTVPAGNDRLIITNGAKAYGTTATIGGAANTPNESVVVTGSGSVWSNSGGVTVGYVSALGNSLTIDKGAQFQSSTFVSYGSNNTTRVINGSSWTNFGGTIDLDGGYTGNGNQIIVSNNSSLFSSGALLIDAGIPSSSRVYVDSSSLGVGGITEGSTGQGNLVITNGSTVKLGATGITVGNGVSSTGSTFAVDGSYVTNSGSFVAGSGGWGATVTVHNAVLTNTTGISVGVSGGGGNTLMTISGGSQVSAGTDLNFAGNNGGANNSATNTVVLTDAGTLLTGSGSVYVGKYGLGYDTLVISNGAYAKFGGSLYLGYSTGSLSNQVIITGSNSTLVTSGDTQIGNIAGAKDNSLVISNGGKFYGGRAYFAYQYTGTNNSIVVTGPGSLYTNIGLYMAYAGSGAKVTVSDGAQMVSSGGSTLIGLAASSNSITVTDPGSIWTNYNDIQIGQGAGPNDYNNQLIVNNGAKVIVNAGLGAGNNVNIGYNAAATNSTVAVTGPGSFLQALGTGTSGGILASLGVNGQLQVSNGGMVEANTLNFSGTGASATNIGGTYQFTTGSPTITTNNSYAGSIVLDGGTISFRGVSNANVYAGLSGSGNPLSRITYLDNNTLRLDSSSNLANVVSYTFDTGVGQGTNFAALELINGTTRWESTNLNIGSHGSMLVSNTTATIRGVLANAGTIEITGSIATFKGSVATGGRNGIQADNSQVTIQGDLSNLGNLTLNNSATVVQGNLDTENALAVSGGSLTVQGGLTNVQNMTVTGASWTNQGSVNNQGVITVVGNAVIQGTVTNATGASVSVTGGSLKVQGNDVNSQGSITVNNSAALFLSPLTIGGSYISDPSTNTFGSNVTVSASGFMTGTPGDVFNFQQSLFIHSTNNIQFDLSTSTVEFSGGGVHTNAITGQDVGANAFGQNFEYGRLTLASTNDLLQFTQGGTSVSNALYVQTLDLSAFVGDYTSVSNMVASLLYAPSSINVYYLAPMNGYLNSLRYPLESFPGGGPGGFLIPAIPEPSTMLLWVMGAGCIAWLRRRRS